MAARIDFRIKGASNKPKFDAWLQATKTNRVLKLHTITGYTNDVAAFVIDLAGQELHTVTAARIAAYLKKVKPTRQGRVLSAISDFWAFAMQEKWVERDEPRLLKFKRSKYAIHEQLDFFKLLLQDGLDKDRILALKWIHFAKPFLTDGPGAILVGKRRHPIPRSSARLEMEFRCLASRKDLATLLDEPIVASSSIERIA